MARSRSAFRTASNATSESSSSSSPERAVYDDTDFSMAQGNDSDSSIGASTFREMTVDTREQEICGPPISRLPPEIFIAIFAKLVSQNDLRNCMLVSKSWARNSVELLWHRPLCNDWGRLENVIRTVQMPNASFAYHELVKRLNLSERSLTDKISDGTVRPLHVCRRVERLTLTNCIRLTDLGVTSLVDGNRSLLALDVSGVDSITDISLLTVAYNSTRLQGLNITGCRKVTDDSLITVSQSCRHIKRLKLNKCAQLTDKSIIAFADNCPQLLEIDLQECKLISGESVSALISRSHQLRELRLAQCSRITDDAFLRLPYDRTYDSLRILDLTSCDQLRDEAVQKIVTAAPRLRNLTLAKCRQITDRALLSIAKLGKNLHLIHLGHCQNITDGAVVHLVKMCNRIRYIDLACCHRLTDVSVQQLATLPKLRRIGLVKCQNVTDRSILALAKAKPGPHGSVLGASCLERVHLSYCIHLTLQGIHALLNHCPRLTHLSLTGVQAFIARDDLTVFCRAAPSEFTDHQRDVFCVFSGEGVKDLRNYLNQAALQYEAEGTRFNDDADESESEIVMATTPHVAASQHVTNLLNATGLGEPEDADEDLGEGSENGHEEQG
ncbi:RNI-like protein [Xylona heveae TC161]|uniref:RNI-like protein n=1 Tax=Xylona heveae (strain CBS 132557 / TC161) TaxID=1328760 RepID=A0A165GGA0_XYLHT|nr:RNI-like protein [Xylona heveae TC161]KZF22147.1 RNI-like protein [Xylona heveae TC161]